MNCVITRAPGRPARKTALLVTASMIALAVASSDVRAADLTPILTKAPPVAAVHDVWTWWGEGGFTGRPAGDPAIGLPPFGPFASLTPGVGYEAAIGFDFQPAQWSPYHVSGQFRYGQNRGASSTFFSQNIPLTLMTPGGRFPTPAVVNASGTATLNDEDHWLVDFAIGRDYALGSGNVQAKLGIRIAEINSSANGLRALVGCVDSPVVRPNCSSPVAGSLSFQSRSRFLGVGPRFGVDGSEPLGGSWAFDYLGGVAVLFGDRSLNATQTLFATTTSFAIPDIFNSTTSLSTSQAVAVFNLDAQAGISYWLTRNFKLTASYRFDGYWNAMTIIEPNGNIGTQSRFFYGPMLRGTITFN